MILFHGRLLWFATIIFGLHLGLEYSTNHPRFFFLSLFIGGCHDGNTFDAAVMTAMMDLRQCTDSCVNFFGVAALIEAVS